MPSINKSPRLFAVEPRFYFYSLCLLAHSGVQYVVLLFDFTVLLLCCDVCYDSHINNVGFVETFMSYLCLFPCNGVKHFLTILVKRRVSYNRQEQLTLREKLCSSQMLVGSLLLIFFVFCVVLCCVSCSQCCQFLWIVHYCLLLRCFRTFI